MLALARVQALLTREAIAADLRDGKPTTIATTL
jgi:hypothetical protein